MYCLFFFFFFSSRRRHTRFDCDWSSDVCSSDLRLTGGIAHDFNNVLTAVLGSIELLLLDAPPDRPHREELDIIRDAATRAKDLIRQLLAFSARQVLQPMVVDLNRLVKDIAKLLRRLIGEDIALETALASGLGAVRRSEEHTSELQSQSNLVCR